MQMHGGLAIIALDARRRSADECRDLENYLMAKRKIIKPAGKAGAKPSKDRANRAPARPSAKPVQSRWQRTITRHNEQEGFPVIPPTDYTGWLITAAEQGVLDEVKGFVELGADLNAQHVQFFGSSPLSTAAARGHLDVVRYLVEHGADVNRALRNDSTPLTIAAENGHLEVVKYLVEYGADVNREEIHGNALMCAIQERQITVIDYLKAFASPKQQAMLARRMPEVLRPKAENVPAFRLAYACRAGLEPTVRRLLKEGIDVNARTIGYRGQTPLRLAAKSGHTAIVEMLLEAGADPNLESYDGRTPLMDVAKPAICRMLLAAGADVNAADDRRRTVLMSVTDKASRRLLTKAGAR
jgi:ankyrin repeat protein